MMSIEEYGKAIGVEIEVIEGSFYVRLAEYEKLLHELRELKESNISVEDNRGEGGSL